LSTGTPPPLVGTVQDYDPATDTCSVTVDHVGLISPWIDGVPIAQGVSRALLCAGVRCLIQLSDPHSYCSAQVVGLYFGGSIAAYNGGVGGTTTQNGRATLQAAANGFASAAISYAIPYTNPPQVTAVADNGTRLSIQTVTATQFTVTNQVAVAANSYFTISYTATGT